MATLTRILSETIGRKLFRKYYGYVPFLQYWNLKRLIEIKPGALGSNISTINIGQKAVDNIITSNPINRLVGNLGVSFLAYP